MCGSFSSPVGVMAARQPESDVITEPNQSQIDAAHVGEVNSVTSELSFRDPGFHSDTINSFSFMTEPQAPAAALD